MRARFEYCPQPGIVYRKTFTGFSQRVVVQSGVAIGIQHWRHFSEASPVKVFQQHLATTV
jgi:hypothetical protein